MKSATGAPGTPELHVRLFVQDRDDTRPWVLDTRRITAVLPGASETHAMVATTDRGKPPLLRFRAGESRTVDLYYPLPPALANDARLPNFAVDWQIRIGNGVFGQRTAFRRRGGDTGEFEEPSVLELLSGTGL